MTSYNAIGQEARMHIWPVQDAKARFSEFLDTCLEDGPQIVSRRGAEAAVLVPIGQWRKLQAASRPTLKDLLLSDTARVDLDIPARGNRRRRVPEAFD
jgi:antitoxin Phd